MAIVIVGDNRLARDSLAAAISATFLDEPPCLDNPAGLPPLLEGEVLVLLDYQFASLCEMWSPGIVRRAALYGGPGSGGEAMRCLNLGYAGYMPRTMSAAAMICAIRLMLRGERFVPSVTVDAEAPVPQEAAPRRAPVLSPRQSEILSLVATGASNKHIARALRVEEVTVKSHVKAIFRKLGVHTRTEAARFVLSM